MELELNNGFCEMTQDEMMVEDGGSITITAGAIIGLCCLGGGFVVGLIWG